MAGAARQCAAGGGCGRRASRGGKKQNGASKTSLDQEAFPLLLLPLETRYPLGQNATQCPNRTETALERCTGAFACGIERARAVKALELVALSKEVAMNAHKEGRRPQAPEHPVLLKLLVRPFPVKQCVLSVHKK